MSEQVNTKKLCVFCGNIPDEKTKEHVLPKWLIEFTGDPNRTVNLGIDVPHFDKTGEIKQRKFSFSSFHFPACNSCNSAYSKMEHKAKLVMIKIFDSKPLYNEELTTLLDWFDKVRMGLWLAFCNLDGHYELFTPRLHIATRIRQKDRALLIYDLKNKSFKELGIIGVNAPIFYQVPNCFALIVNSKLFINVSSDFLLAKNLGFPYARLVGLEQLSLLQLFDTERGTEKPVYPVLEFPYASGAMEIYQVISSLDLAIELNPGSSENLTASPYLLKNSLQPSTNNSQLVSKIFFKDLGHKQIGVLQDDEELNIQPNISKSGHAIEEIIRRMIAEIQPWLFRKRFPVKFLPEYKKQQLLESQKETFQAQKIFAGL